MPRIKVEDLKPIPATRAKVIFGEVLHETAVNGKKFLVNRQGKPVSVILGYREYLDLVEQAAKGRK